MTAVTKTSHDYHPAGGWKYLTDQTGDLTLGQWEGWVGKKEPWNGAAPVSWACRTNGRCRTCRNRDFMNFKIKDHPSWFGKEQRGCVPFSGGLPNWLKMFKVSSSQIGLKSLPAWHIISLGHSCLLVEELFRAHPPKLMECDWDEHELRYSIPWKMGLSVWCP